MIIDGYIVDRHQCDDGRVLLSVSYVIPGGRIDDTVWSKCAFIVERSNRLSNVLHSIVNLIARLDIPNLGYAQIVI